MKRNFLRRFDIQRGWPFHWGGMEIVAASILSIAILSLGSGMFGKWISAAREAGLLPISLHSLSEADYSVDPLSRFVPAIGLDIIRDLLGFSGPPETEEPLGITIHTPITPSPTPTPTIFFSGDLPTQIDPTEVSPPSATPTQRITATATQSPLPFYTSTPTATHYQTDVPVVQPTETKSPPSATKTPQPTNNPQPTKTDPVATATQPSPTDTPVGATPTLAPTKKPTEKPPPTSEPSPVYTATSRPTHSPTLALTPTARYTPGVTVVPTVQP